ncbi:hypothetical protein C9439_01935 [archaeon SCG-AAA382B04]|nr:hypothetical protein C9439_01935 [archaeon SCG-AAA382B04]
MGGLVGGIGEYNGEKIEELINSHTNRGRVCELREDEFFLAKFNLNCEQFEQPLSIPGQKYVVIDCNLFEEKTSGLLNSLENKNFNEVFNTGQEFAFVLLDQKNDLVFLGRDLIGSRPLFYSKTNDGLIFGSERHEMLNQGYSVSRVDPGCLLKIDVDKRNVFTKRFSSFEVGKRDFRKISRLKKDFLERFKKSVGKRTRDIEEAAVAFSGGVDSSFLAKILSQEIDLKLFTVGLEGSNDIEWSEKASDILELPHKKIVIGVEEIKNLIEPTLKVVADANRLKIGVGLPFYLLSREVKKHGFDVIFSGQGSDELFLGYDKYRRSGNPKQKIINDLKNNAQENTERDEAICMDNSVEIRNPYMDRDIVDFALSLPYEINLPEKRVVRETARSVLPKEIWRRNKKSVQYGTKIDREIDRVARREGYKRKMGNHVDKYLTSVAEDLFPSQVLEEVSNYFDN